MRNIIDEITGNALVLVKILLYYLVESSIFGLVLNILWMYIFKDFFDIQLTYFHFLGILMIYRIFSFDMAKFNTANQVQYVPYNEEDEE